MDQWHFMHWVHHRNSNLIYVGNCWKVDIFILLTVHNPIMHEKRVWKLHITFNSKTTVTHLCLWRFAPPWRHHQVSRRHQQLPTSTRFCILPSKTAVFALLSFLSFAGKKFPWSFGSKAASSRGVGDERSLFDWFGREERKIFGFVAKVKRSFFALKSSLQIMG